MEYKAFITTVLLFFFSLSFSQSRVIYVNPKGLQVASYESVSTLQDAISLVEKSTDTTPVTFLLADGNHNLDSLVSINALNFPLTIKASNPGKAKITSGKYVKQSLLEITGDIVSFTSSFPVYKMVVNDKDIPICCSSKQTEFAKMKQFSGFQKEDSGETYSAVFTDDEISKMELGCYIYIYCKWVQYKLKVIAIDTSKKRVKMNGMSVNVNYVTKDSKVYYSIYNSRKLLEPSTFCYVGNRIYYRLNKDENIGNLSIYLPTLETFLCITNIRQPLTIYGIHFSDAIVKDLFVKEIQGKVNLPQAINIINSANVSIERCEFSGHMGYSVGILNQSFDCIIKSCYFHDLNGGGLLIGDRQKGTTHHILINDNLIKSYGRVNASCIGIFVTRAYNVTITNNTICDGYYSGISLGWTWGYGKSYCSGNYIANNHIHHLMQGVLSDGAGVYTLGKQEGTIIENNYIHDIVSRVFSASGASLLYFDEGSSNIIARNNVCLGSHTGFHEHYGKCNRVEDNIFAYTNLAAIRLSNAKKDSMLIISNNIIINDCGTAYNTTLAQNAVLENNKSFMGTMIDKVAGLKKAEDNKLQDTLIEKLSIEQLFTKGLLRKKFSYGVTSQDLKIKSELLVDYLNRQNKMVVDNFSPCSSYFKRFYK